MGKTIMQVEGESMEIYKLFFKSFYIEPKPDYINPVTKEPEPRDSCILFGVKKVLDRGRVKELEQKERASIIAQMKKRIRSLKGAMGLLISGRTIEDVKERPFEDFSYVKFRSTSDFYTLIMMLGKCIGWKFVETSDNLTEEELLKICGKFFRKGFWKGKAHYKHFKEEGK